MEYDEVKDVLRRGFVENHQRLQTRATQLASDSAAYWATLMGSPTPLGAHANRMLSEAGSGRTRVESNTPAGTQIVGTTG